MLRESPPTNIEPACLRTLIYNLGMLNTPWVHLVVASWFVGAAFAQTNTSTIAGVVSDASGSVLPNATITVTQAETGFERQAACSTSGDYVLPQRPPGKYVMNV